MAGIFADRGRRNLSALHVALRRRCAICALGVSFTLAATLPLMHLPAGTLIQPHGTSAVVLGAEWGFGIAAFWIILLLVRGTRLLMHAIYLRRVWKRAKPASSEPAIHALLLCGPRAAELCTSEDVDSRV